MFAVLGDLHFGTKQNSVEFLKIQLDYLDSFIDDIKSKGIDTIIQTGDFLHYRKTLHIRTFFWLKERFLKRIKDENLKLYVVDGNHDQYYMHTNDLASTELLSTYDNIEVIHKNKVIEIDGKQIGFIPWIANKNDEETFREFIKENKCDILVGHFDIKNFQLIPGHISTTGFREDDFLNFELVLSGHYHQTQRRSNILYVGTPYELTWSDFNSKGGYWIYDNGEITLVQNKNSIHKKIYYTDEKDKLKEIYNTLSDYKNKIIKIVIVQKKHDIVFNQFLTDLEKVEPYSVTIIDNIENNFEEDEEFGDIEDKNILDIIDDYLKITDNKNENQLKIIFKQLYMQSKEETEK
jgi:DNA repair exonuclease SbcCD nuclease subunit